MQERLTLTRHLYNQLAVSKFARHDSVNIHLTCRYMSQLG